MNKQIVALAIGAGLITLIAWIAFHNVSGEWKPTGDGKTVVHSRTGEIRFTATGLTVEETERRNREKAVANKREADRIDARQWEEDVAAAQQRADLDERRKVDEQAARDANDRIAAHNATLYPTIKVFVMKHDWNYRRLYYLPIIFASDMPLQNYEVSELIDYLLVAKSNPQLYKVSVQEVDEVLDALSKWGKPPPMSFSEFLRSHAARTSDSSSVIGNAIRDMQAFAEEDAAFLKPLRRAETFSLEEIQSLNPSPDDPAIKPKPRQQTR